MPEGLAKRARLAVVERERAADTSLLMKTITRLEENVSLYDYAAGSERS
jgi:hypothetical protein